MYYMHVSFVPFCFQNGLCNGLLVRYVKLRVAHVPRTFSLPPRVCDPGMHHGTSMKHMPCCMLGSLSCGFLWSRCRGKRSRHPRSMRNPQFYVSGKRPMVRVKSKWWCIGIISMTKPQSIHCVNKPFILLHQQQKYTRLLQKPLQCRLMSCLGLCHTNILHMIPDYIHQTHKHIWAYLKFPLLYFS